MTYRDAGTGVEVGVEPGRLRDHFALFVEESSSIGTGLAIFKPEASSEIEFRIRDEAGMDPHGDALTRGDFQQRAWTLPEWFQGTDPEILRDFRGLLFLRTAVRSSFAPLGLRFGKRQGSLSAVPVIPIMGGTEGQNSSHSSQAADPLYFPDYVEGEGWSVQLVLGNLNPDRSAPVVVEVYDSTGQSVSRFFDSENSFEIPALGSRLLRSAGGGMIRRGWIEVKSDPVVVAGLLTYRNSLTGIEVGVDPVELGDHFALFVEESTDIGTGLAILKPDSSSELELRLRDEEGRDPLEGSVIPGEGFHQRARTIPEWFDVEGVDQGFLRDFRGLLFLRAADDSSFAPVGLRFGKRQGSLSAVPVIPLPSGGDDLDTLLDGVAEIASPGVPGLLCVYGPEALPVIVGAPRDDASAGVRAPVVAAARWQDGRVVALGHDGYFVRSTLETADTGSLMMNAFHWAAGETASARPRIGVVGASELRAWLTETGHDAVAVGLTPESLRTVDVVAVKMWNQSDPEIEALSTFVRGHGGLVTVSVGWAWARYLHPDRDLVTDHPGNRLLAPVGIQWADDYLSRTSPKGYAVDGQPHDLTHAGSALDAAEAHVAGRRTLTQPEIDQALDSLLRTARSLPPDDTLLAPRLTRLAENADWPSAERPVRRADVIDRVAAAFFAIEHRRTPPESVHEHPAAADFPGSVPDDATRHTRNLTIDTTVPRWHSTGLYAAPGELVTVTVPAEAAEAGGFHVRVGAHTDGIWPRPEWKRMPEISRHFAISETMTRVANAFGGMIYLEVPDDADLGSIAVKIEGAVAAPRFVLGETDPAAWRNEIRHAPAPWAEIVGRNMIVTTDASEVRGLDDPVAVAETWDRVLDLSAELAAWLASARSSPERFVVDRQISHGYMHAGYPLMAHLDQQANLVNAERLSSDGNWGFFHEVGHNHQSADWTFDGTVEVTVNLFTLYVYEFLCGIPPTERWRGSHLSRAEWMALYDFDDPDFELWKREPFLALIMYAQMQQAFGWDAYRQVFTTYRALSNEERPKNDDEKRDQWLVRFSQQVGRNLGPFFETWGVPTSQAARDSINDLPAWMPPGFPPAR
ncbi:MAG: M60 family metallopeptidase [Acidobacteriota bacterium]|nr:M60 family metallopeptidase [Acidobacteriota bacterium]